MNNMQNEIKSFFKKLLDLREGAEEKKVIIENIKDDSDFSSARFWILVFAVGLASIGLNVNSIPVIIGAMLISPIMGPIVSIGMSLAINDWGLMRRSFRNFLTLTIIGIVVSTIYFYLSPITNAQSELLSRIQPTIFDVMIAVFGGIVGFIGLSRDTKFNNVIPGVAIATALIPPLCTVGYGIATMQTNFILGAAYLFLINSIFICLSSLFVAKFLDLPKVEYQNLERQKRVRKIIMYIIVIMVTPAIYLAFTFVEQNNFNQNVDRFINDNFVNKGEVVIYRNVNFTSKPKTIDLAFLSTTFTDEEMIELNKQLINYGLGNTSLNIRQNGSSLTDEEWQSVLTQVNNDKKDITALVEKLNNEKNTFQSPSEVFEEAKIINPSINNIAIGSVTYGLSVEGAVADKMIALIYTSPDPAPITTAQAEVISNWLKERMGNNDLRTIFIPEPIVATSTELGR